MHCLTPGLGFDPVDPAVDLAETAHADTRSVFTELKIVEDQWKIVPKCSKVCKAGVYPAR